MEADFRYMVNRLPFTFFRQKFSEPPGVRKKIILWVFNVIPLIRHPFLSTFYSSINRVKCIF